MKSLMHIGIVGLIVVLLASIIVCAWDAESKKQIVAKKRQEVRAEWDEYQMKSDSINFEREREYQLETLKLNREWLQYCKDRGW